MASLRLRRPPMRSMLLAVLVLGTLHATTGPVAAQGPLSCLNCDFELVTVEWNGSADPGTTTGGVFEVRNTGESRDSYAITASADDPDWTVETDPTETADVPPGSGLFAEAENAAQFRVRVLVPDDAPANSKATITVTVESQNAEDLEAQSTTTEVRAKQVYGWTLDCTQHVTAQKTKRVDVRLNATNTGNGRDRADIAFTPIEGIVVPDPERAEAAAGATAEQSLDVGIGLRADDGIYTVRWDLRSAGDPDTRADCTTTFEVTGGGDEENDGNGENGESPTVPFAFMLMALLALAFVTRTRSG